MNDLMIYGSMEYDQLLRTKELFGSPVLNQDFFDMFCGELLDVGSARSVYTFPFDNYVIKIEPGKQSFQNVEEWLTWNDARIMGNIKKWFAPCIKISPNGRVLIQERVYMVEKFPNKIPSFFTDLKKSNFGVLRNGNFVCCDYGVSNIRDLVLSSPQMIKAEWKEE